MGNGGAAPIVTPAFAGTFSGKLRSRFSRKDTPSLFLKTHVLPVGDVIRKVGMQRNFRRVVAAKPVP